MDSCPYCGAALDAEAHFCTRCGEPDRTDADHDRGWLHPVSRQYCAGIAHGARSVDPEDAPTDQFRGDLRAALADLAALDGLGDQRATLAPIDPAGALAAARDAEQAEDLDPAVRGLLVAIDWLAGIDGPVADDLLAQSRRLSE
ncbi:MAG: zinc ribbon domain-containing protein [Halococcoides sp.]